MSNELRSFLRIKQVMAATGMSRSWIYETMRRGDFPAPIPIGARAVAWDSQSIAKWQASRIAGKDDDEIRSLVSQLEAERISFADREVNK